MKIRQLLLLPSNLIVHAIVFLFYFDSTQIRISFIIFLGIFDSASHLGKLKIVCFLKVLSYGYHYPWLLGSFSNIQYWMKKLRPFVEKGPETFIPRPITPRCHSFAAWVSNMSLVSICNRRRPSRIKDKFSRLFSKFSQNCPSRVAGKIFWNFSFHVETQSAVGTQNKQFSTQAVY